MQKKYFASAIFLSAIILPTVFPVRVHASSSSVAATRDTNVVLKDPRPFKCICYSGYRDGQAPGVTEPSEAQVREDLTLLAKYTHEIRTYGSGAATHGYFVPKICDDLGLKVHLGIWVDNKYDDATNFQAIHEALQLVRQNHKSIKSIIVGNEFMFRVRNIDKTPSAPAEARLIKYVKMVRDSVPKSILVTNADTWGDWQSNSDALIQGLDYVTWHTHPWWENQPIAAAAGYVASRYSIMQTRVNKAGGKPLVLGETGWPTAANNGPAIGSPENQYRFFKELQVWSWNNYEDYFAFTGFDEQWKGAEGAVGAHWGLFFSNRTPNYIITNIATLMPKFMQSENPDLTTGILKPVFTSKSATRMGGSLRDALGRGWDAGAPGWPGLSGGPVLVPANGSARLLFPAP